MPYNINKKKDSLIYVVAGLLILGQGITLYLALRPSAPDLTPFERVIDQNLIQLKQNEALMNELSDKIRAHKDTIQIIRNQKQTFRETFYKDVTRYIANDSTNRALQYRSDIRAAHQYLLSGRYFER